MKWISKAALLPVIFLLFTYCGSTSESRDSLAIKRIRQKIDANAGLIKNLSVVISAIDDSTYNGVQYFYDPMVEKEMRITKIYHFTADLDSIVRVEEVKSEMKSEGGWVPFGL